MPAAIDAVVDRLVGGAHSGRTAGAVLPEMCARVIACGIPVWRAAAFILRRGDEPGP
jgi:hypothetical protein